jgi:tRNA A64-2'-O-ribosylphosphate transferase
MLARMDGLLTSFLALGMDLEKLRAKISKPMRPMWITPESTLEETGLVFEDFHPVICCTSSRRVSGTEVSEGGYIQGAGDDTENWAHGLTPPVFWANFGLLMDTPEEELPLLIQSLVAEFVSRPQTNIISLPVPPTSSLYISSISALEALPPSSGSVRILLLDEATDQTTWHVAAEQMNVGIGQHKIGSRNLRAALPHIATFLSDLLSKGDGDIALTIACTSGKDFSIGVGLAILCLHYDNDGKLNPQRRQEIDKNFIRQRLGWLMAAYPDANPSRATLQSVNSFLMDRPR